MSETSADLKAISSIHLANLKKDYGRTCVIEELNVELAGGEFTVILGPSGCGKSTLLNMIAGLEPVTSGSISIGSVEVQDKAPKDRGIAMVFQNYALYPHMSVADNIGYSLKISSIHKEERKRRIEETAKVVDLTQYLDRRPHELSGGQRQRVAIARAIVREPKVLLFDEPLSNLDAKLRQEMRMQLSNLHKRIGATSVFVTHDQVEAMTLADKILIMNGGKIEQFDTPDAIYHNPASVFVAEFVGSPSMNLLTPTGSLHQLSNIELATTDIVGIRPEDIKLSDEGMPATIIYREDLGSHSIVMATLYDGQKIQFISSASIKPIVGRRVHLTFATNKIRIFDKMSGKSKPLK